MAGPTTHASRLAGCAGAAVLALALAAGSAFAAPKPPFAGMGPMNELPGSPLPPGAWKPPIDSIARTFYWSRLEPADDTFDWRPVDAALAANGGTDVKLRILAGIRAPAWLKRRSGSNALCPAPEGGVYIEFPFDGEAGCVPKFWTAGYLAEYRELMAAVAARYDAHPRLLQVMDSACMTVWAEPFMLAAHRPTNHRLWRAGLNKTTSEYCHDQAVAIHTAVFTRTRSGLALNDNWDWPNGSSTGSGMSSSWTELRRLVNDYKRTLGPRLALQYNGFDAATRCPAGADTSRTGAPNLFCYLAGAPQPKGFQLRRYGRLVARCAGLSTTFEGCFRAAVDNGLRMGAIFIEPHTEPDPNAARQVTYLDFDRAWITGRDATLEARAAAAG